jgi:hypothetical protein
VAVTSCLVVPAVQARSQHHLGKCVPSLPERAYRGASPVNISGKTIITGHLTT